MWLAALGERSAALNREHGLGDHVARRSLGAPGSNWLVALRERSNAMNRAYGLGVYRTSGTAETTPVIHADDRSGVRGSDRVVLAVPPAPTIAPADGGFAWDDAALSAVATLAVGVLLGAGAVSIRYRRSLTLR
jgi:hypothetical protein